MSSDLTFITNETGKSLRDRFGDLLDDTRCFDCLVGYFFISGFYKLYPFLETVEKIRILVGLQTDRTAYGLIQKAKEQGELNFKSHASAKEQVSQDVMDELERSTDSADIEMGVQKFVEWIRSGKLEIRAHASQNLHAKVYIMTFAEGDRDKGRVITGSSNLTQAGLQDNLEFNVELKNSSDYDFAIAKFNELWDVAVDVSAPYQDTITVKSPYAQFTPYELYLKFLYEYFRNELNRPSELEDMYVPVGFMKLKYQEEAVLAARKVLDEYGGVFLSDVVGLGKTYMAALLAQQLDGRHLVIAPPQLLDKDKRGSWPNVFSDFQVRQTDFESIGKLDQLLERDVSKYTNVFIDESHRFRTETTQSYEALAQICRGKRVILVSATPLNNTPQDILRNEVVRVGRFADEHDHPQPQLFAHFLDGSTFVVGADARRCVCHQVAPGQSRRVPVADGLLKAAQLVEHFFVAVYDAGKVHHLAQAQHPVIVQLRRDVVPAQVRAGGFHIRRGHARRHHHKHGERVVLGRVEHVADAIQSQHIGDLVRVNDDGRRAARDDSASELVGRHQRAFDVDVCVNKAGTDVASAYVNNLLGRVALSDADDAAVSQRNIRRVNLARVDVHQARVLEQDFGRLVPPREFDELGQFHFKSPRSRSSTANERHLTREADIHATCCWNRPGSNGSPATNRPRPAVPTNCPSANTTCPREIVILTVPCTRMPS